MDWKGKQGDGMRTISFRYENYTNRRAFLRSYPLQWGADDKSNGDMVRVADQHDQERPTKKIIQDDKCKKEDVQKVVDGHNQRRPVKKIIQDDKYIEEDVGKVVDGRNQRRPMKKIIQDDKYNIEGQGKVVDGRNQRRLMKSIIQDDKYNKDVGKVTDGQNQMRPVKKIILTVLHCGGDKVLFFRRFKHKLALYAIACVPAGLKTPNALLSA